jgi:uncharacterized membrane protein
VNQSLVRIWARVRRRLRYALITAMLLGTLAVVTAWLGLPTKYRPVNYGRPLSEIWWYFPIYGAVGFVVILLMPKGFDKDLGL